LVLRQGFDPCPSL